MPCRGRYGDGFQDMIIRAGKVVYQIQNRIKCIDYIDTTPLTEIIKSYQCVKIVKGELELERHQFFLFSHPQISTEQ